MFVKPGQHQKFNIATLIYLAIYIYVYKKEIFRRNEPCSICICIYDPLQPVVAKFQLTGSTWLESNCARRPNHSQFFVVFFDLGLLCKNTGKVPLERPPRRAPPSKGLIALLLIIDNHKHNQQTICIYSVACIRFSLKIVHFLIFLFYALFINIILMILFPHVRLKKYLKKKLKYNIKFRTLLILI